MQKIDDLRSDCPIRRRVGGVLPHQPAGRGDDAGIGGGEGPGGGMTDDAVTDVAA
jgi:hypothetical protein